MCCGYAPIYGMADFCIGMVAACRVAVGLCCRRWALDSWKRIVFGTSASWRDAAGPRRREHGGGAGRQERLPMNPMTQPDTVEFLFCCRRRDLWIGWLITAGFFWRLR